MTDAVADLPPDVDIPVVPLRVIVRGKAHSSADFSPEEYHAMLQEIRPGEANTSQPSPQDFLRVFRSIDEPIVYVAASSKLSGTINAARVAARMTGRRDIYIVDSLLASGAQGYLAFYALWLARQGVEAEEIAARVEEKRKDVVAFLTVGSLDYLRATGRIGAVKAFVGKLLDVLPIIELREGVLKPVGIARRREIVDALAERLKGATCAWVGHAAAPDLAQALADRLGAWKLFPMGPVISTHLGPGAFGGTFIRGFNPCR